MVTPFEMSDAFTEKWADLNPITATSYGIGGRDHLPGDYSPEGHSARADLYREARRSFSGFLGDEDPHQKRAAKVTVGWLDRQIEEFESAKWARDLNHIHSPLQNIRDGFDVMDRDSPEGWEAIADRMATYPEMIDGYRASLQVGLDNGDTVARRQVESAIEQADSTASEESRFLSLTSEAAGVGGDEKAVAAAVDIARRTHGEFADWLRSEYLPAARPEDAVGRERYLQGADEFLGIDLDPEETSGWAWHEIHRIRREMKAAALEIDPGKTVEEVIELLDTDPRRSANTRDEFSEFVSDIQQQAIRQLADVHFDVPDELRTITVNIAPPGGPLGAWYVSPSEDFTRPGSIWYAPGSRVRIPHWQEVSTAYHEGFPGHHLQVATSVMNIETTSRFHRLCVWYSGSGEGWALYAERLMDELGYFENPEYRLGLLSSQMMRSVRVVLDIGVQLGLTIPDDAPLCPGETWNFDIGVDYMNHIALQPRDVATSEVKRYLGWWGQAIAYKVGEREILKMREAVKKRDGNSYVRKEFHRKMLDAGAIRLDHLWEEMV